MTEPTLEATRRIATVPHLLVALDFDGTLSPLVDDPDTARALPESAAAVEELTNLPATTVALVSGRTLAGLDQVAFAPREAILVGSHGAETRVGGTETGLKLTDEEQQLLEELSTVAESIAARFSGARVERKPSGTGLHTRLATRDDAETARAEVVNAIAALHGSEHVVEKHGKDILEFSVRASDKGSALTWIREHCAASAVLFIGDDVTDEDGFRVLEPGDVGVKVGEGATTAEFRVADPVEVSRLLAELVRARRCSVHAAETSRTT